MTTTTESVIKNLAVKVRKLAATKPDNVYQPSSTGQVSPATRCSYLGGTCTDGTVGCLVGQAFLAIGFTADQLRPVDHLGIEEALENLFPIEISDDEYHRVRWLESVQNAQDNGHRWCEAIEVADQEEPL